MGAVALDHILHQGRVIEPGSVVPDGPWIDRLVKLGKVELKAEKPKVRKTKTAEEAS
jgi:hypothetical protein